MSRCPLEVRRSLPRPPGRCAASIGSHVVDPVSPRRSPRPYLGWKRGSRPRVGQAQLGGAARTAGRAVMNDRGLKQRKRRTGRPHKASGGAYPLKRRCLRTPHRQCEERASGPPWPRRPRPRASIACTCPLRAVYWPHGALRPGARRCAKISCRRPQRSIPPTTASSRLLQRQLTPPPPRPRPAGS